MVYLGDYIYEGAGRAACARYGEAPIDLAGYRRRHAEYKATRPPGRHAGAPWSAPGTTTRSRTTTPTTCPTVDEAGRPPEEFLARRAAAYQAYYEHMPLRHRARPTGPT